VHAFTRPVASTTTRASPIARLQRMSRWMRALIAFGAACLLFGSVSPWFTGGESLRAHIQAHVNPAGLNTDAVLAPGTMTLLLLVALPNLLLGLFTLLQAWRLFGAYGRGHVFGPAALRHIRAMAWALIATSFWHVASSTLSILLLTWHNPPGQRQLSLGVSWEDYLAALFGGLLIAMAWAMAEAGRIEQDNAGFV
jgi:Protein of unknown function (DUF2975)